MDQSTDSELKAQLQRQIEETNELRFVLALIREAVGDDGRLDDMQLVERVSKLAKVGLDFEDICIVSFLPLYDKDYSKLGLLKWLKYEMELDEYFRKNTPAGNPDGEADPFPEKA